MTKVIEVFVQPNAIKYEEGQIIGKCKYIREIERGTRIGRAALFECPECKVLFETLICSVKKGDTVSCGCVLARNKATIGEQLNSLTHGDATKTSRSTEYNSWSSAKRRCFNVTNADYPEYGGSGITMSEEWASSYSTFLKDMGRKPTKKHSLDRWPDKNGNYEKENCRWATPTQQARNTRRNTYITYKGESKLLVELSEESGIRSGVLSRRLKRGWAIDDLLLPIQKGSAIKIRNKT